MPSLKTSLLLVGNWPAALKDLGAVICHDLGEALFILNDSSFDVVAITVTSILEKRFQDFHARLRGKNPSAQVLLVAPPEYDAKQIVKIFKNYEVFRILSDFNDPNLNEAIVSALEKSQEEKQNQNLEYLIQEQNQTLTVLQNDLEKRIEKRARSLSESRHRLRVINSRTEALRRSMLAVYRATSLPEMEQKLNESLASVAECSWIKIATQSQEESFHKQVQQLGSFTQLQIPLFKDQDRIGSLFFMRPISEAFTKDEAEFLNRVAEAVALAVVRIQKLNDSQTVKEQWETTFNSVSEPVAIISSNYDIVQTNSAFQSLTGPESLIPQKCFQILFHRDQPCSGCKLGLKFNIESRDTPTRTYEVYSQNVRFDSDRKDLFFNIYHDNTEKLRIEQQLFESAKRAELGTIGSSIAHELNNPLGGIITFTQILKSETPKESALQKDLAALEEGAQRCKEIIQNLLEFSRRPKNDEIRTVNLAEILNKVILLMDVKTKPLGLSVELQKPDLPTLVQAENGRLSQVFAHILQQQLQNLLDNSKQKRGQIIWKISQLKEGLVFEAYDNSAVPLWDKNVNSFSYSLVEQVLRDFAASLEIPAPSSLDLKAKISFSRPVLLPPA